MVRLPVPSSVVVIVWHSKTENLSCFAKKPLFANLWSLFSTNVAHAETTVRALFYLFIQSIAKSCKFPQSIMSHRTNGGIGAFAYAPLPFPASDLRFRCRSFYFGSAKNGMKVERHLYLHVFRRPAAAVCIPCAETLSPFHSPHSIVGVFILVQFNPLPRIPCISLIESLYRFERANFRSGERWLRRAIIKILCVLGEARIRLRIKIQCLRSTFRLASIYFLHLGPRGRK